MVLSPLCAGGEMGTFSNAQGFNYGNYHLLVPFQGFSGINI